MILSFRNRALERLWERNDGRGLNPQHVAKLRQILDLLEHAREPEDMNVPKLRFHKLTGHNPSRFSVHVNANWRVTFSFDGEDADAIDYEDYH